MDAQAQVTGTYENGRSDFDDGPRDDVSASVAEVLRDLVELGELQWQLLSLEARDLRKQSIRPLGAMVFGVILALGTVPVALVAFGCLIAYLFEFSLGAGFAWSAFLGVLVAGICVYVGYRKLVKETDVFRQSRRELTRNVFWLKHTLSPRGHPSREHRN